jgi:ankyrin repeat protein
MPAPSDINEKVVRFLLEENPRGILTLLERGAFHPTQVFTSQGQQFTLLPAAIERSWADVSIRLIELGADVNRYNRTATPLMQACADWKHARNSIIEALLKAGAAPNLKARRGDDGGGETALLLAAEACNLWAVKRLLDAAADPTIVAPQQRTAVYMAMICNKLRPDLPKMVRLLVRSGSPLLGAELHQPIFRRDVTTTALLLKLGCPPNTTLERGIRNGPEKGVTPLTALLKTNQYDLLGGVPGMDMKPTVESRVKLARLLLAARADPNLPDVRGKTALMLAVIQRNLPLAELLVDAGADPYFAPPKSSDDPPAERAKKEHMDDFLRLFQRSVKRLVNR